MLGTAEYSTANKTSLNAIYQANRVGIDIWNNKDNPTSFDIEIYATYTESASKISPESLIQYTASTMSSTVNASKNQGKSVVGSLTPVDVSIVNQNKKRR